MSLEGVYDRYRGPSYVQRLWGAFVLVLTAVAAVSVKNQDIEPFGL